MVLKLMKKKVKLMMTMMIFVSKNMLIEFDEYGLK